MQPLNMIEMKVAQEEKGRFIESYEFINLMESIACIEDDNVLIGFDKNADCIARVSIIPSICSKKRYFHLSWQKPLNPYPARHEKSYMAPPGRLPRVNRDPLLFVYIHGSDQNKLDTSYLHT